MGELGFTGNNDLYGLGIRIGYYTAALSIWIGNLWAPCEIYFLRHVTIVFLVAMLIGVSVLSMSPSTTHSVEPFMLMHVSYCTYYMGLMIPPSPEFLAWEKEYFSFFVTATVGIALHSYDTWYWWIGQAKMIPTPGTQTLGLFVYFGRQDLYGWVRYVVKVYLAWFIYTMIKKIIQHVDYRRMEKALDQEVPPSRLKVLCDNWQNELDAATKHDMAKDGMLQSPMLLSPPSHSRSPSASSLKSLSNTQRWSTGFDTRNAYSERASPSFDESKKEDYGERSFEDLDNLSPAPEPGIKRTMSEKLRYHLLGWKPDDNLGITPIYSYHPSLESLDTACAFLKSLNEVKAKRWKYMCASWDALYATFIGVPLALLTHRYRPRSAIAVRAHIDTLSWQRNASCSEMMRRALVHPAYQTLSAKDIALASRILLTVEPLKPPNRKRTIELAYVLFCTCSLLVIGSELTIQWNYIRGVQNLMTVGQLIPASIGVGGLGRVIYSAIFEKGEAMDCLNRCKVQPRKDAWKDAGEAYSNAVNAMEKRRDLKGKQKSKEEA